MKKLFILLAATTLITSCAINKSPKAGLTLKFNSTDGTNAMSVSYHSGNHNYYAIIGGNSSFPLEVFNKKGKSLGFKEIGFDARSLWYNDSKMHFVGNAYYDYGTYALEIDKNSIFPRKAINLYSGQNQPLEQSSGAFNSKQNSFIYHDNGYIFIYNAADGNLKSKLKLNNISCDMYDINSTTVIYTSIKSNEYGLLNYLEKKVYLFDEISGDLTTTIELPSNAVTSDSFRFSYSNKRIWLYDVDTRTWTGYKIK